ncbi:MAG: BTAD domain-containing putative transcriptional regulator [Verrucomicrobiota bacterium]
MRLRFRILGPLEATVEGEPVALGSPMQRGLLAALLLRANEVVSRDRLIDALWGDDPPASAAGSLQIYVHGLRRALGAERIETHGSGYLIRVDRGELDLDRFVQLVERARRALADDRPADAEDDLRVAMSIPTGPPLADLGGRDAFDLEAGRLEDLRLQAIELQNDAELALGRHDQLAPRLEALVAEHRFRERFRAQQMLALYRSGRQQEALAAYRDARRTLVEELGIEPGRALQELEQAILRQDAALAPSSPRRRPMPALPAVPTRLIGRELEVTAVSALLRRDDVRQVTLTGPGGSGKTRLALAVAEELAPRLRDGAAFVDLAPLDHASLLVPTLATALGIEEREESLEAALAADLRERAGLLVLDNFERLLDAAAWVSDLLRASPRLLVLVTSRLPLRLSWEHVYSVPPLTPPDERCADLEALSANDAVRLFAARASAVDASFELSEDSAEAVATICRRLDGLPLAIELAAARSNLIPPQAMAQQVDQMLPLLAEGPVDVPDRHRSLQATLDWSHALLPEPERAMFERLAVFSGGCAADTATQLDADAAGRLAALVDHSLLRRIDRPDEPPRFHMLEPIREYALALLAIRGEEDTWRLRHAELFTSLAETAESEILAGADPAPVLCRLESEHDNFRAALGYLHAHGGGELELRLASALTYFWRVRGHLGEGRQWLEGALATEAEVPALLRAMATSGAGRLAYRHGDYSRAHLLHEQALALARSTGDLRAIGQALSDLGGVALAEEDLDRADALYGESAEALRAAGHKVRLGTVLGNLASIRLSRGDAAGARSLAEEALALQEVTGDREGSVFSHLTLARTGIHDGHEAEAAEALRQALALIDELEYHEIHGHWLLTCAELASKQGNTLHAARLLGAADANFERLGIIRLQAEDIHVHDTVAAAASAELGQDGFRTALAQGRDLTDEQALPPSPRDTHQAAGGGRCV